MILRVSTIIFSGFATPRKFIQQEMIMIHHLNEGKL